MSKIPRQAIVSVCAIAGAQLANLVVPTGVQTAQSSSCLQWASESISAVQQNVQYAVNPPPISEQGYYDVRTKRDESVQPLDQSQADAVAPGATADAAHGTQALPLSPGMQSARPSAEMSMIPDLTESQYQAARRAMPPTGAYSHE